MNCKPFPVASCVSIPVDDGRPRARFPVRMVGFVHRQALHRADGRNYARTCRYQACFASPDAQEAQSLLDDYVRTCRQSGISADQTYVEFDQDSQCCYAIGHFHYDEIISDKEEA